ncbi:MAG TPA: ABC transporter ATP-binding protein [Phycisphaerae bacterium]|nr:ABC transporter ATP-binding protein [Phycisphaerae bacterium]
MAAVSIESVRKRFGRVCALDGVSVDILPGELFFLLGPSGCGKTTLLRCLAGFYIPDDGRILLAGRDVTRLPPQQRDTGMVFQNYALWPHMTVEANVGFGLAVRRVPRAQRRRRVGEVLDLVRMREFARRRPNQLSGGQQQRVALARALAVRPRCLLLDEPLSNLDAKLRLEMRTEIRRICKDHGLTAVYVTHDQKEALTIADRMAVLFAGRIAQVGAPTELYTRPATAAVADFLGETNFVRGRVRDIADGVLVDTAIGAVRAAAIGERAQVDRGAACTLSIRPEAFVLMAARPSADRKHADRADQAGDGGTNRLAGQIAERIYMGDGVQLTLDVGGAMLRVNVVERADVSRLEVGDALQVRVDPRDVVILG